MMRSTLRRLVRWRFAEPAGVALVVALALAGSLAEAYPGHHYAGLHLRSHPSPAAFVLVVVAAAALLWRRAHPVAVYVVAVAGVAAWAALGQVYGAALVSVLVAFFWLAMARPGRAGVIALGAGGTSCIWLCGGLLGPWGWWGGPQLDMWAEVLAAGAFGSLVAARRSWRQSEALREEQLGSARADETRRQVTAERLRIARELHDAVAHSMAMINVQASAAATLVRADPARATESIQAIRRASKDGLRELRSILDVLRQVDEAPPAVALPDRSALEALVEATSAAGIPTSLRCDADLAAAPPGTALAVYRIAQESLTNVVRHAAGATAEVTVSAGPGRLVVEIVNGLGHDQEPFAEGSGSGLAGMAERARSLGGTLSAGPLPDGGFRVHSALPTVVAEPSAPAVTP